MTAKIRGDASLIERLRAADRNSVQRINGSEIFGEAADMIDGLIAALEPFASYAAMVAKDHPGWNHDRFETGLAGNPGFRLAAFRRALLFVDTFKNPATERLEK